MNMHLNDSTIDTLRNMYKADASFERLVDWFSERQKNSVEMPVRVAGWRTGLSEGEVKRVFQALAEVGCGRYIKGSRGYENRMRWEKSIIGIAAAAKGEAKNIEDVPIAIADALENEEDQVVEIPDGFIEHNFNLRPGVSISIALPTDLTSREAERMASFIQTLPFSA